MYSYTYAIIQRTVRTTVITLTMMPLSAHAQGSLPTVDRLYGDIQSLLQNVIGLLMTLASVVFAWGVIQYFSAGPDEAKASDARKYMMYGILTLAVMLSAWTLAYLFLDTFDIR